MTLYKKPIVSEFLEDESHPLTKSSRIVEERGTLFNKTMIETLFTEEDYPIVSSKGELILQKISDLLHKNLISKASYMRDGTDHLLQLKLDVLLETAPPRYSLLRQGVPETYPWQEILDEVEDRMRDARKIALMYDIQRPIYTAYGVTIEDLRDIQRDINFLLPLLQFDNYVALWLLSLAVLLQLVFLLTGISKIRREERLLDKETKKRLRQWPGFHILIKKVVVNFCLVHWIGKVKSWIEVKLYVFV